MFSSDGIYEEILQSRIHYLNNLSGSMDNFNQKSEALNPVCGDQIQVNLLNKNDTVLNIGYSGRCCPIAKLSASLMTEEVKGKSIIEAKDLFLKVQKVIGSDEKFNNDYDGLLPILIKQLCIMSSIKNSKQSTKCVLLPWQTMIAALDSTKISSSASDKDYSLYLY